MRSRLGVGSGRKIPRRPRSGQTPRGDSRARGRRILQLISAASRLAAAPADGIHCGGSKVDMPRTVVCAGLFSSASTWLFNVVAKVLSGFQLDPKFSVLQFYADSVDDFPDAQNVCLVAKCHTPKYSLLLLPTLCDAHVIITVRDPRDAVVSLVDRFGLPYERALKRVRKSAGAITKLAKNSRPLILRYEDKFFSDHGSISMISRHIGVDVSNHNCELIFDLLRSEAVKQQISAMQEAGVFGTDSGPDSFDVVTHWHPGHVGDGSTGKYLDRLPLERQAEILIETKEYCDYFNYLSELPDGFTDEYTRYCRNIISVGSGIMFRSNADTDKYLISGWAKLGPSDVWTLGKVSRLAVLPPPTSSGSHLKFVMTVIPYIVKKVVPKQRIVILINGKRVFRGELLEKTDIEFLVTPEMHRGKLIRIGIIHPDRVRPRDVVSTNEDRRQLAFRLLSLLVTDDV